MCSYFLKHLVSYMHKSLTKGVCVLGLKVTTSHKFNLSGMAFCYLSRQQNFKIIASELSSNNYKLIGFTNNYLLSMQDREIIKILQEKQS